MITNLIMYIKTFSISTLPFKILNVEGMTASYKLQYNIVAENKSAIKQSLMGNIGKTPGNGMEISK